MASSSKAKSSGVSSSSFLDLKAELSKKEDEYSKAKRSGKVDPILGVKRPAKKPTLWSRKNKSVLERSARDFELEAASKPDLETAKATLERKAALYDKLKRGKTGGLREDQYDSLLVDFDRKTMERGSDSEDSSESDVDESLTVPKPVYEDDPLVEYEDEFGRVRTARRSEVPRHLVNTQPTEEEPPEDDPYLLHGGNVGYFPVYEPSAERVAKIEEAAIETNPAAHYDASREIRAKGAGFYAFSADEETRARQMEELKNARMETEKVREEVGAEEGSNAKPVNKAMEKRKREIEERRKAVEAKRRKLKGLPELDDKGDKEDETGVREAAADDFLANLEKDIIGGGRN